MAAEAMAQKTNVPEIQDAIVRIRTLSADEKARELAYQRELALHEKATWEHNLKKAKEKAEKAEKEKAEAEKKNAALIAVLKAEGYTDERIAEILSVSEGQEKVVTRQSRATAIDSAPVSARFLYPKVKPDENKRAALIDFECGHFLLKEK